MEWQEEVLNISPDNNMFGFITGGKAIAGRLPCNGDDSRSMTIPKNFLRLR